MKCKKKMQIHILKTIKNFAKQIKLNSSTIIPIYKKLTLMIF